MISGLEDDGSLEVYPLEAVGLNGRDSVCHRAYVVSDALVAREGMFVSKVMGASRRVKCMLRFESRFHCVFCQRGLEGLVEQM